jgi:Holliday junction resolvase RusA-like endonuclease
VTMHNAVYFQIPGECIGFARAGANGKLRFTPKRQRDFANLVKLAAATAMVGLPPFTGPLKIVVRATYLVPASWPKKRKETAFWKTTKPDASNLLKLVEDALHDICYADDATISEATVQKTYGSIASTTVEISELSDDFQHRNISI